MMYDSERQHKDNDDGYTARKSLNEWFNKDVTRTKLAEAPRKEYQLLVRKRRKRKRCRSTIRRKKKVGNTQKANGPEIGPLDYTN
eukprot:5101558-Ditylum_brightwellii.AAC.1